MVRLPGQIPDNGFPGDGSSGLFRGQWGPPTQRTRRASMGIDTDIPGGLDGVDSYAAIYIRLYHGG